MEALFKSEALVAKRNNEWDNLFTRISTYTDSTEHVYVRKQNVQFTSLKHGFRKRFANRKKETRPKKLPFEVQDLDNDGSDTEVLSDDSSIYSANDELESDISDSESVNSVQYVLQCNEQRKLPDFNTKVENCQSYMLQNACFNQGVKENNPNVFINNSSVNKEALQNEKHKVNEVLGCSSCSTLKSLVNNKDIKIRVTNPVENERILTTDKSQISNSENKQLKSILSTTISENFLKINKKITFSSDPDSEIDIEEFQSDDNVSIKENGNETDYLTSRNSNLFTSENTKTLSTKNIALNNEVNLNRSKLLNNQNVNNLEKAISTIKTNEKPKIYSSAARKKRQLPLNIDSESSTSENTLDQISEIKIAKSKTTINTTLNQFLYNSSNETHIHKEHVAKLIENESLVEIKQCNKQNAELRTNAIRKTPLKHKQIPKSKCHIFFSTESDCTDNESSILNTNLKMNECNEQKVELRTNAIRKSPLKHKQTPKNKCHIFFSTESDCSDNESSILNTNLNETFVKNEDTIKKNMSRTYLSSSTESDSDECINHSNIDLKSNNFEKGKNKEYTIRKENSKYITNKENHTIYTSTSLLKEKSIDNCEEEHNKENRLPKENSTRMKSKELNKNTNKRKMPKKIGMKIFSTETHCSESECNLILKSKSNVLAKSNFDKNNFIRKNTTLDEIANDAETKKQYSISSTPNINAMRQKGSQEQCLKENNVDDEITELVSCVQSAIPNEEHMSDITQNVDENSPEDDEIFETTIKNKEPENLNRKQVEYTNKMKNIIDENTTVNDNYEDITMSDTVVKLRYNKNGQKIITDSRNLDISSLNGIGNKIRSNTLIKSSRKKKSRENILESPTLSTKSNSDNQNSKIIKCRQRLFNSSSENDDNNSIIQLNSTVLTKESRKTKQDQLNMDKVSSEDLNKNNQTHSLPQTTDIINKIQNEQNYILRNHKKRKLGDSNCGSVKQMEKKPKITTNNTSKHSIEQVIVNESTEYNVKQEYKDSNNYNTTVDANVTSQENTNITCSQSVKDEDYTKRNVSEKKNGKKRRSKCRKEIRFIAYSTDDYTNDEDNIWSISSIKNRTPLSLEYFLDDDVF